MKFGDFLKLQREQLQWTQPQAALEIGIEQSYLSKLENNKSMPSEDIFNKLSTVYQFSLRRLTSQVSDAELERLSEISAVRQILVNMKKQSVVGKRRWLMSGLLLLTLGAGMSGLGLALKDLTQTSYRYESKGIINQGESDFLYTEMPEMRRMLNMMENPVMKKPLLAHPLFQRLDHKFTISEAYLGEFFDEPVGDGKRRFFLRSTRHEAAPVAFYTLVFLGVSFVAAGFGSFYLSRRW